MSQQNEEDDQRPDEPENEFEFYFQFTKPLVLYLPEEDKSLAAAWVEKLEAEPSTEQEKRLRLDYLKLLLFVLQRGRLSGIFRKQPPDGPLQPFSQGFSMSDMGNLIIDQDDIQGCGGGDTRAVPYTVEISNDLREFVAAQEIPNFGVQMYYAWSSDDPIHKWSLFDEDKFPQYLLDKIKLLKEIKSDEKTSTKTCGVKKICDIPLADKYVKTKVKSPQEIEKAQGRSYQTYLGLVGPMGGGFKDMCDDDPEKYSRQEQRKEKCIKKPQRKCARGQNPYTGDPADETVDEEYDNFLSGLSGNSANQSRCYPSPAHSTKCESQMKPSCDVQPQTPSRSCSPKSRTDMTSTPIWVTPVERPVGRKMCAARNAYQDSFMAEELQNACQSQKRSASPSNRSCLPNRNKAGSPTTNCKFPNREESTPDFSSCSCSCPRDGDATRRPMPSAPSGRPGEERSHMFQGMKQWTTPVDASFRGLAGANRCPSTQNETMPCYDRLPQEPPMTQQQQPKGQDDSWYCDMADSKRKEKKVRQMGQDRREVGTPYPRSHQTPSPCAPPMVQQGQKNNFSSCKNMRQEMQDPCRREQQDPCRREQQDPCRREQQDPCRREQQDPCRREQQDPCRREQQDPCRREQQDPCRREQQDPCRREQQDPYKREQQDPCRREQQDPCRREQQDPCRREPQDLDCSADTEDSIRGAYGSTAPSNFSRGMSEGPSVCEQIWRSQNAGPMPVKSMNCNYAQDYNNEFNAQQLNYGEDPCPPKKEVCPPQNNEVCPRTKERFMPSCPKMPAGGGGGGGGPYPPSTRNNGFYAEGMKQKPDSYRDKCDMGGGGGGTGAGAGGGVARKLILDDENTRQRNNRPKTKPYCAPPPPQQEKCPTQPPCPPQPQCPPLPQCPSFPMKTCPPMLMDGGSPNIDAKCGRSAKALMNKQSQQACWPSQQPKKQQPQLYETYNVSKGARNGQMNMKEPCVPDQGLGNFRGPYNYMNQSNMQSEECPDSCRDEEEDDECISAIESPSASDERAQGSSTSVECYEGCEEDAEMLDEVQSPPWAQNQNARQRECYPDQKPKARDPMQMQFQSAGKRKGRFFCSTPKQPSFASCESTVPNITMVSNRQIDQTCQNFYSLPDATGQTYVQREENYPTYTIESRGPRQIDNQGYGNLEQPRGACFRNKDKKKRAIPPVCDDNVQFDQNCDQPCGY